MKLSIIIPAYNEGSHIQAVINQILDAQKNIITETDFKQVELVVVNDGSHDSTVPNIEELLSQKPGSFVFKNLPENQGYGAALKAGFGVATGDYLSFMDADGTIDPLSFIHMYNGLKSESADIVLGRRFGDKDSKMPPVRKLGNYFFASLLSFLSGEKVNDTASGVRLFKREVLEKLYPLPDGMHFTPAMSSKAVHEKIKIVEVPIEYDHRSGESKLSVVKDGYRFLRIILGTVLLYNPFKVFFCIGMLLILVSAGLLAEPIWVLLGPRNLVFTDYIYRSIGALYLFVTGFQIIQFGILARFLVSTFFKLYESGDLIHKVNQKIKVYDRMALYGSWALLTGIIINVMFLINYTVEKTFRFHWAWLLFAAGIIITGLQMMITGLIMKIVKKIKQTIDVA
jgi:glycosyltransferase involved in cell wall biosynthesis